MNVHHVDRRAQGHLLNRLPFAWRSLRAWPMMRRLASFAVLCFLLTFTPALAQFDTIINVPPDVAPFSIGSNTQLNVFDGGAVPFGVRAGDAGGGSVDVEVNVFGGTLDGSSRANAGSTFNIVGGSIGERFRANAGSVVNLAGGAIGRQFAARPGSEVNISGGVIGDRFDGDFGSTVRLHGGEFMRNKFPQPAGTTISLGNSDVVTGTLSDGSPFIFFTNLFQGDSLFSAQLVDAAPPPVETTPLVIADNTGPNGLRSGQTLTLADGGQLAEHFAVVSATLNITGGTVGDGLEIAGGDVTMSGGSVEGNMTVLTGSVVNVSGGSVGRLETYFGSETNLTGGQFGNFFRAWQQSSVNISGGTFGRGFVTHGFSDVRFAGGEFLLNGTVPVVSGGPVVLDNTDVLTGTFEDGSPFVFTPGAGDDLAGVTFVETTVPMIETTPIVVSNSDSPTGLRAAQMLTVTDGGQLPENFAAVHATLNVAGGVVGSGVELVSSQLNITGGTVHDFAAFADSSVTISGGQIEFFNLASGSTVQISGGSVGSFTANDSTNVDFSAGMLDSFNVSPGGEVNISGGVVGDDPIPSARAPAGRVNISGGTIGAGFRARAQSEINISGGTIGDRFQALSGSNINVLGNEFFLGNELLDALVPGQAFVIDQRDVVLRGILADGSSFNFTLNPTSVTGADFFDAGATLTVTLVDPVPEPGSWALLGAVLGLLLVAKKPWRMHTGRTCHQP